MGGGATFRILSFAFSLFCQGWTLARAKPPAGIVPLAEAARGEAASPLAGAAPPAEAAPGGVCLEIGFGERVCFLRLHGAFNCEFFKRPARLGKGRLCLLRCCVQTPSFVYQVCIIDANNEGGYETNTTKTCGDCGAT